MKRAFLFLHSFCSLTSLYAAYEQSPRQMINSTTTQPSTNSSTPSLYQSEVLTPAEAPLTSYFSYRPKIEKQAFYGGSEYLYWKLDEAGMNYAITDNNPLAFDPQDIIGCRWLELFIRLISITIQESVHG